ncbi:MAG: hypothetical protein LBK97_04970 [Prevotellaceae bacterium]|jgi:hypothetical protein|nr:hypothetical protein [Prevotellaceae bacterium]
MIPSQNDIKILFDGEPEKYLDLYKEEINEFIAPDEDDDDDPEFDERTDIEDFDAEELFEILFTIPMTTDDDYCEMVNVLADEYLPYDVDADYEDNSPVIYIDEDRHVLDSHDGGYAIIRKFNEMIKPDFEIRAMKISLNEDNVHSLLILQGDDWKEMEAKYGEKVAKYFEKIDEIDFYTE